MLARDMDTEVEALTSSRRALLCDADGNLFPSEEQAFIASSEVVNTMLASLGARRRYEPESLRRDMLGHSFRDTARRLLRDEGLELEEAGFDDWVILEKETVTRRLRQHLSPDAEVQRALDELSGKLSLAVVTSSASERLDASLEVTGLGRYFPSEVRFSAEDSLPRPKSKPDPAIYQFALRSLGLEADEALAMEDSPAGVESAARAGLTVLGSTVYVPTAERSERQRQLSERGAYSVVETWAAATAAVLEWVNRSVK